MKHAGRHLLYKNVDVEMQKCQVSFIIYKLNILIGQLAVGNLQNGLLTGLIFNKDKLKLYFYMVVKEIERKLETGWKWK